MSKHKRKLQRTPVEIQFAAEVELIREANSLPSLRPGLRRKVLTTAVKVHHQHWISNGYHVLVASILFLAFTAVVSSFYFSEWKQSTDFFTNLRQRTGSHISDHGQAEDGSRFSPFSQSNESAENSKEWSLIDDMGRKKSRDAKVLKSAIWD